MSRLPSSHPRNSFVLRRRLAPPISHLSLAYNRTILKAKSYGVIVGRNLTGWGHSPATPREGSSDGESAPRRLIKGRATRLPQAVSRVTRCASPARTCSRREKQPEECSYFARETKGICHEIVVLLQIPLIPRRRPGTCGCASASM